MFEKFLSWVRNIIKKLFPQSGTDVLINTDMSFSISLWSLMYEDKAPWIDGKKVFSLNLSSAIASEIARLTTLEMQSQISGSSRADYLNEQYKKVLSVIRTQLEYGCSKGGLIMKPYVDGNNVAVDFVQADALFPISFDSSGRITGCVFLDQIKRNGKIYTRLEIHQMENNGCIITNIVYESGNDYSMGREIELTAIDEWKDISPTTKIENITQPLFGYFKVPQANTEDTKSPLGVSVYARATSLIKQADEQYSRILWEYDGSELAVEMADSLLRDQDGGTKAPKGKERLFRQYEISTGVTEKPFYEVFSPEIRDSSLFNGLNKILQRIEFNCGLAYGTLSDPQIVEKTAEEIKTSKQRSYSMVADTQKALQKALEDLIYAIDTWATIYNLAPRGNYETSFEFDDSIIVDSKTEQAIRIQEVSAGLIKPEVYLMWRYGVTEEQAKKMMPSVDEPPPPDDEEVE